MLARLKKEGYSVAVDAPFAGALVPLASYRKDKRIMSVMIEVNRRLYMDEHSGSKAQNFAKVRAALGGFIMTAAGAACCAVVAGQADASLGTLSTKSKSGHHC